MSNVDKIQQLKHELAKLQAEDDAFDAMAEDEKLAVNLHDMLCRANHSDGCGWFYEIPKGEHNWAGSAHEPYLTKAHSVMQFCDIHKVAVETVVNLVRLLRE